MRSIVCLNCSQPNHSFKDCRYPILSYGIIGFNKDHEILLVQRKDSIGYIDLIRGKYKNTKTLEILIGEMTYEEKLRILSMSFEELWDLLWMKKNGKIYKDDYLTAKRKFENPNIDIKNIIKSTINETKWDTTEFSIPKGRKNIYESSIECAIREFIEESGFKKSNFTLLDLPPIQEIFFGSNGTAYCHVYYIAEIHTEVIPEIDFTNVLQAGEIKYINWFSKKSAMNIFRNYSSSKRYVINKFFDIIF
jgi:Asfivirus mRNA-decapping protein g5R